MYALQLYMCNLLGLLVPGVPNSKAYRPNAPYGLPVALLY